MQYSPEGFQEQLLKSVIANNMSFRSVENSESQRLLHMLRNNVSIPSAKTLAANLRARSSDKRMFITEAMHNGSGKISIALDAWTPSNKLAFLAIKAYFIDKDWKLRSMLIGFGPATWSAYWREYGLCYATLPRGVLNPRLAFCPSLRQCQQ